MSRGRPRIPAALLLVGTLTTSGCGTGAGEAGGSDCGPSDIPAHDTDTIVVEGDSWAGYAPFRDRDLLEGTGYRSLYVEQPCEDVRADDLTAGRADVAITALDQYLLHQPDGTVVGVVDQSAGADALVLDTVRYPYLDDVDDLPRLVEEHDDGDGPLVAYTAGSPSDMLLRELASTSDELDLADLELVPVDRSATAYSMLRAGEAQLAVVSEPDVSAARDAGYAVPRSSEDVPGSLVHVIVASNRTIDREPAAVQAVVDSYYTTIDRYLADRDSLVQLVAEDGDVDEAVAESIIDGIKLYGTHDADVFMNDRMFPLDQPQVVLSLQDIGSVLALNHPDVQPDAAAVDGSFLAGTAEQRYGAGGATDE